MSRGIVVAAYEQLLAEGYLASRPGGATRVAAGAAVTAVARTSLTPVAYAFDFRPGRPDVSEFPRAAWLRSLRRAVLETPSDRLGYLGGRAIPELRSALATYLNRVRGTSADPADIVIATGFVQGLAVVVRALGAGGATTVAVEDPADPEYREIIAAAGLRSISIPVDESGLRVDLLAATPADAVLVTAAHQYPTGGVLPPERRSYLVDWAAARGAVIIEDDYDAEYRYDREPIGAIQGLAPEHVIYAGSASKILAPGLRLGWLVVPPRLVESITAIKQAADNGSAAFDQLAFADFLDRGELDRHLRRMRPIYRRRRDRLLASLARWLPDLRPAGASAGLHVLTWLPLDVDEAAVIAAADAAGIALSGLTPRRVGPGSAGLIFGYGSVPEGAIDEGIRQLAEVVRAVERGVRGGAEPAVAPAAVTAAEMAAPDLVPCDADRPVVAVYGTLRRGERNHGLMAGSTFLATATIAGALHDMPASDERDYGYPALVDDPAGRVVVELYRLPDGATLGRLDELEAYDPADQARSEYIRRPVDLRGAPVARAWVYVYAGDPATMGQRILGGDWTARQPESPAPTTD